MHATTMSGLTCVLRRSSQVLETVHGVAVLVQDGTIQLALQNKTWTACALSVRGDADTWVAVFGSTHDGAEHVQDLAFPLCTALYPAGDLLILSFRAQINTSGAFFLSFPPRAAVGRVTEWLSFNTAAFSAFQQRLRDVHAVHSLHTWLRAHVDAPWHATESYKTASGDAQPYYVQAAESSQLERDPEAWSAADLVAESRAALARSIRTAKSCRSVCSISDYEEYSEYSSSLTDDDQDEAGFASTDSDDNSDAKSDSSTQVDETGVDDVDKSDNDEDDAALDEDELDNDDENAAHDDEEKDHDVDDDL